MNSYWELTTSEQIFFKKIAAEGKKEGKPQVLWGWKRDKIISSKQYPDCRTVYFSADFGLNGDKLYIKRSYFFLDTRSSKDQIRLLKKQIGESRQIGNHYFKVKVWKKTKHPQFWRLRIEINKPNKYDKKTIKRRLFGKPRLSIEPPKLVKQSKDYNLSKYAPFALCCGSGLSAESNLPLLGSIHRLFVVDDSTSGRLIFGASDYLPKRLITNIDGELKKFCEFSVQALKAKPSKSHYHIANLWKKGLIQQIFTDNMDNLLTKVGVPYTQTRLSIFPDRYKTTFTPRLKSLLVIGVAVDRRDVIKQARRAGLKIIVINPVFGVAPHSRNMDYLRAGDIFFKGKASEVLPKIIIESGF